MNDHIEEEYLRLLAEAEVSLDVSEEYVRALRNGLADYRLYIKGERPDLTFDQVIGGRQS